MSFANLEKISADPAANAEIVFTADEDMIVHSVAFTLVTDANAANRVVRLIADDGADVFFRAIHTTAHVATITGIYSAFPGALVTNNNNDFTLPLPADGLRLRKNDRLSTVTLNRQAGDNYGTMILQVERV